MNDNPILSAGACHCGAAAFQFEGEPDAVIHCHCNMCRRLSGAAYTTWVSVPKHMFRLLEAASLKSYAPTRNSKRFFCAECGTHVYTEDRRYAAIVGIPAGVLHGSSLPKPAQAHYFVDHKAAWHALADELPRYGGDSGMERLNTLNGT